MTDTKAPAGYFAYALDDGEPDPLVILAEIANYDGNIAWGHGYSTQAPRGEYGAFPRGLLTRELSAGAAHVLRKLLQAGDDPDTQDLLAVIAAALPRIRMDDVA